MAKPVLDKLYGVLTDDEDARVCKDIPDEACEEQPKSFLIHIAALACTKTGDKFADPKIVLAWLLTALGAPAIFLSLLVPVREALSLLPQMVVAGAIRRIARRKFLWSLGSIGQALALIAMGIAALLLDGTAAGSAVIALLALFSLSRGVCSVTYKDVLGKTIAKTRRGSVSGYADAAAGVATLGLALWLIVDGERTVRVIVAMLFFAAGLWFVAAAIFSLLKEQAGATEGGGNALTVAVQQLSLLRTDRPFRHFVIARTALLGSALMAPYFVALAQSSGAGATASLGGLLLAASLASLVSSSFWGRFADLSSRQTMAAAGALAGLAGFAVVVAALLRLGSAVFFAGAVFVLYVAHAGVRIGRSTHVVDIATAENRAAYTAVSNTLIGAALLLFAAVGWLSGRAGPVGGVIAFSLMVLLGAFLSWRLEEAQE